MSRRGLGEVFHYFISEDEQVSAREGAGTPAPHRSRAGCWCLALDPARPLSCALGLELAATLGEPDRPARVLASFDAHPLLPRSGAVVWQRIEGDVAAGLESALARPDGESRLITLALDEIDAVLAALPATAVAGVILPVDGAPWGLAQALGVLRRLDVVPALRVGVVVVGAEDAAGARRLFEQLAAAAERQLGRRIELLGAFQRDPASYQSLLAGQSILDADRDTASARDLRALGERLSRAPAPGESPRSPAPAGSGS